MYAIKTDTHMSGSLAIGDLTAAILAGRERVRQLERTRETATVPTAQAPAATESEEDITRWSDEELERRIHEREAGGKA